MKKKHLLPAIGSLTLLTITLLVVIFVKNYQPTPKPEDSKPEENQVAENEITDNSNTSQDIPVDDDLIESPEIDEKPLEFVPSDKSYFDDAIIIGDSRTVGIFEYGDMGNITYYATEGLNVYDLWKEAIPVKGMGNNYLEPLLKAKEYKKIYIMIGINELGYDMNQTVQKYKETLDKMHEIRPEAIIYICSNLHVTAAQSSKSDTFNNKNIDLFNDEIKKFADHETFFYLDTNQKFNDANGNLGDEYTSDNVHILAKYYAEWADWFAENTIVKE